MKQLTIKSKISGEYHSVYDIRYDKNGYPHFLIYKDNQWRRVSAKFYEPVS